MIELTVKSSTAHELVTDVSDTKTIKFFPIRNNNLNEFIFGSFGTILESYLFFNGSKHGYISDSKFTIITVQKIKFKNKIYNKTIIL